MQKKIMIPVLAVLSILGVVNAKTLQGEIVPKAQPRDASGPGPFEGPNVVTINCPDPAQLQVTISNPPAGWGVSALPVTFKESYVQDINGQQRLECFYAPRNSNDTVQLRTLVPLNSCIVSRNNNHAFTCRAHTRPPG